MQLKLERFELKMMLCSLRAEREVVTVTRAGLGTACWQPHKLLLIATACHRMPSEAHYQVMSSLSTETFPHTKLEECSIMFETIAWSEERALRS